MIKAFALGALLLVTYQLHAQSTCATALPIAPGIHVVAAVDGNDPPQTVCTIVYQEPGQHAEWYSYTAITDTIVLISTYIAGQPQVNTRVNVYTGACDALQCLIGNDDGGPQYTSRVSFFAEVGETYYIAFDDRWSAEGFSFELSEIFYRITQTETFVLFQGGSVFPQGQPFCVVDMDNDNLDDIVAATQNYVNVNRQLPAGGFETVNLPTPSVQYMPTWSMAAGDLNGNGYKDLVYGNGYGVSLMLRTEDGNAFTQQAGPQYVFSQRTNTVDINNDGHLDAFVCHDVAPNVYYINDGNGNFTFTQGGLGFSCGNYGSIWIDYDNDGDMDCFVAKCGCDAADLLMRNEGNGTFSYQSAALGPEDYHQSWSSAWGDFDNDGDLDVLIGSSGSAYHKLMRNNGDGTFSNSTPASGFDILNLQSIEWTTHDFNNDGLLDILGGGSLMINHGNMRFSPNTYLPGNGAVGDLNNDGFLDVMGQSGLQYNGGNGNHWLRINTIGTVSNRSGIGARLTLTSALGTQIREVRSGDGFSYMSSLLVHFGLATDTAVQSLTIRWPSGIVQDVDVDGIDHVITVVEPLITGLTSTAAPTLQFYPNPATDQLQVTGVNTGTAQVIDLAGRTVLHTPLRNGTIDVGQLAPGHYVLRSGTLEGRFTKL